MNAPSLIPPSRLIPLAQSLSVLLVPHGGQHTARRNAWAGMSACATQGRERRAAEAAPAFAGSYDAPAQVPAAR